MNNRLDNLSHSAAHLLAAAVMELYPHALRTIGPAIENGFYFDFDFGETRLTEKDLPKIEKKMRQIAKTWQKFTRLELTPKQAKAEYPKNIYKHELIDEIAKTGEPITFYKSGDYWDLCEGGHVENGAQELKHFKLLSVSGAYWRGSEKNKMLTRIYGTIFPTKEELEKYLWQLEEAEKRNHRKLGQELELFAIFPEIGQGLPVWLPNGFIIRRELEDYMLKEERKLGYKHTITPVISKAELFKTSGHLGFYDDSMYPPIEVENEKLYLKPMSCPGAMMVYKSKSRSYRDLPIKLGEFGLVYRYEKSGELHGLQRVRGFTQNDAHIFCRQDQIENELTEVIMLLKQFYKDLGFENYWFRLSLSDANDKKYEIAERSEWLKAENALRDALNKNNLEYKEAPGEAAFYGPKLDVQAVNVFGKEDTISTIQFDFNLPKRFKLEYTDSDNQIQQPYVIHRALIGSFERFFAFLIEHYGGAFPTWLSPTQAIVLPIADRHQPYAQTVYDALLKENIRVELDNRSETLQAKIRDAQSKKIPYMLIVGDREEEGKTVAVRLRNGENQGSVRVDEFIPQIKLAIEEKQNI